MLVWFLPFFLLLMAGLPVVFPLLAAPGLVLRFGGQERDLVLLCRNLCNGMDSFPPMAIPFFMLAGEMMNRGGIILRLVEFSQTLVGHFRAGLAQVNILSSMLLAGLSGSAVADTSARGSKLIPTMGREGCTRRFAVAVTAASPVIGPIIPPGGIIILHACVMGESVAALFLACILPGTLVSPGLMLSPNAMVRREPGRFPPLKPRATAAGKGRASLEAFFPLLTPVIILGSILGGVFTPTEASADALACAAIVPLFILREMTRRDPPEVPGRAALVSPGVPLLVGAAMAFETVVSLSHAPEALAALILSLSENLLVLLLINLLLLIVGMILDSGPAILLLGPIVTLLGVDPVHFALIMSVNLTLGLVPPPTGLVPFVASGVSGERVGTIAPAILPFRAVDVAAIALITCVPAISLALPRLFGFP